jgi:hypothetical protein
VNQARVSVATRSSAPGSSNRCPAPGTISSLDSPASSACAAVELDHDRVVPADDQQRRRHDPWERGVREVRAAAAGHDRADAGATFGRRDQRSGGARARSEAADRERCRAGGERVGLVRRQPVDCADHPLAEQRDVEAQARGPEILLLLYGCEQVDQQRREARVDKDVRDGAVAGAEPAAAAAVREHDDAAGGVGHRQGRREREVADGDPDFVELVSPRLGAHVQTPVG